MLMSNIPVIIVLFSLSWIVGMCIYAVYADCDPLKTGYTKSADAILPFYVEDKYSFIPGLMGIFLSTLFNSALILNVSNLNSLATVTWEDFLSNLPQFKGMPDKKQLQIIKFVGSVYGLMIMGVGFLVQLLSGVIESAQLMTSATSGPLLGVFLLAILVPFANWKGAAAGMIVSHVTVLFVTFGHLSISKNVEFLDTSIEGCTNQSFSSDIVKPSTPMLLSLSNHQPIIADKWSQNVTSDMPLTSNAVDESIMHSLFSISYMYYAFFGTLITVVVGCIVSLLTLSESDAYDSKYIHPVIYRITKFIPGYGRLFSDEQPTTQIKTSTLRESHEVQIQQPQVNLAFDMKSEEAGSKDDNPSPLFKSNIIQKSELNLKPSTENEKYKKLEEV